MKLNSVDMKTALFILCVVISFSANGQETITETPKERHDALVKFREQKIIDDAALARQERIKDSIATDKSNKENEAYIRKMEKKYGKTAIKKVQDGKVWLGITDELCLYGLTEPNAIKNTYTKGAKTVTWIYQGQANGCIGYGCPYLDYVITFQDHKAIAITTAD